MSYLMTHSDTGMADISLAVNLVSTALLWYRPSLSPLSWVCQSWSDRVM